jgi:protein TonB
VLPPVFDAAYLQTPAPDYPALSRRLREEGRVLLRVLVNASGHAEQVEIRTGSGHPRLDQAAAQTVRTWRFVPARRGAEAVPAWVFIPIAFSLDG